MDNQETLISEEGIISPNEPEAVKPDIPKDLSVYVPEKVRKPGEIIFASLWIVLGALGYYFSFGMTGGSYSAPSVFPKFASTVIILCGIVTLVKAIQRDKPAPEDSGVFKYLLPRDVLVMIIMIILYCFALPNLHFFPSSFAFLVAGMVYLYHGKKIIQSAVISACTLAVLIAIFRYVFLVMLP